jgi:hypothetical protein
VFKKREKVNMSNDLVKMARERANSGGYYSEQWDMLADRIEKLEAALREIVGALDDPKGGQHVYDMRNASYIARKALEGKDE